MCGCACCVRSAPSVWASWQSQPANKRPAPATHQPSSPNTCQRWRAEEGFSPCSATLSMMRWFGHVRTLAHYHLPPAAVHALKAVCAQSRLYAYMHSGYSCGAGACLSPTEGCCVLCLYAHTSNDKWTNLSQLLMVCTTTCPCLFWAGAALPGAMCTQQLCVMWLINLLRSDKTRVCHTYSSSTTLMRPEKPPLASSPRTGPLPGITDGGATAGSALAGANATAGTGIPASQAKNACVTLLLLLLLLLLLGALPLELEGSCQIWTQPSSLPHATLLPPGAAAARACVVALRCPFSFSV